MTRDRPRDAVEVIAEMVLDGERLADRFVVPWPWAVTAFTVVLVSVFAATWLSGWPPWLVAVVTVVAAVVAAVGLTVSGPLLEHRSIRVLAHLLLGALVLFVAFVVTALSAEAGGLPPTLWNVVVLGSLWGLGVMLVLGGVFVAFGSRRMLRPVATVGLGLTVVWGVLVVLLLGALVLTVLTDGIGLALQQDIRDDLLPAIVLAVAFLVLPAYVFRQDLRAGRDEGTLRP